MSRYAVVLDTCSLVPVALADTLLRLAECGLYRPLWSARIIDELVEVIGRVHPTAADKATRRARRMTDSFPDALVLGWGSLVEGIDLPDPDDRHVVAAALRGRADAIVTANIKDFPDPEMTRLGIEIQTPDVFLLNQLELGPAEVMSSLIEQADALVRPPITLDELLRHLGACGVPQFAQAASQQRWRVGAADAGRAGSVLA